MNISFAVWQRMKPQVGWSLLGALIFVSHAQAQTHAIPTPAEERQITQDCTALFSKNGSWRAVQMAKVLVQSQGMRLVIQACPFVRVGFGDMRQVLDVRVQVADSDTAAQFVRGPLADGEEVDMGDVHIVDAVPAEDVSPDVQFNRAWLAGVMHKRGLIPVSGYWWAFVPTAQVK